MTPGDFRRLALTLRGAIESAHIQGPRRAGELAQAASLTAPAISRHLRALRQAGLAEETRVTVEHRGLDTVPIEHVSRAASPTACSCAGTASGGRRC